MERRDNGGKKILPSTNGYFHIAFEIEENHSTLEFAQRSRGKMYLLAMVQ